MTTPEPDQEVSRAFVVAEGTLVTIDQPGPAAGVIFFPVGTVIDSKYRIIAPIGEGGMGAVYRVDHLQLMRQIALKTFRTATLSEESWLRFQREAQAIAKLEHPNIIKVYDFGVVEGNLPYYTMELLSGESLAEKLGRGPLPLAEALNIFISVSEGLEHAHKAGIVHRDIKPPNIFLNKSDIARDGLPQPKLVDFGIAKLSTEQSQSLTTVGLVFGSPLYMSPEQSIGLNVDGRADIYSFGCTIFETLTGQPPFHGVTIMDTLMCHQTVPPPRLAEVNPHVEFPQRLEGLVAKMLAKKFTERYQSMAEVTAELKFIQSNRNTLPAGSTRARQPVAPGATAGDAEDGATGASALSALRARAPLLAGIGAIVLISLSGLIYFMNAKPGNVKPNASQSAAVKRQSTEASQPLATQILKDAQSQHEKRKDIVDVLEQVHHDHEELSEVALEHITGAERLPPEEKTWLAGQSKLSSIEGGNRVFHFPAGFVVGDVAPFESNPRVTRAKGRIQFRARQALEFSAGPLFSNHPNLFARFAPDDFVSLKLTEGQTLLTGALFQIAGWSGLKEISLKGADMRGQDLFPLSSLPNLRTVDLSDNPSVITADIADSQWLTRLRQLKLSKMKDLYPALAALQKSGQIEDLGLSGCQLDQKDLQTIARMPRLKSLDLTESNVGDELLPELLGARKLETLAIGAQTGTLTASSMRSFAGMKQLRHLTVILNCQSAARERFREELRKLRPDLTLDAK